MLKKTIISACVLMFTADFAFAAKKYQAPPTNSLDRIFDPSSMSDTQMVTFADNVAKHLWSSFVSGFYSKSNRTLILDDKCFGDWIVEDMLSLDDYISNIMTSPTSSMSDALALGNAFYRLGFKNLEYCRF